jgi:nucleotide-binding universal stress UspA family protein
MKFMVGYNDSPAAQRALQLACRIARQMDDVFIHVVATLETGMDQVVADKAHLEQKLQSARQFLQKENVPCETVLLSRGLDPGEDLVKYAKENGMDHIFLGIEKKSRTKKVLPGATTLFVLLKAPCPVTTTQ